MLNYRNLLALIVVTFLAAQGCDPAKTFGGIFSPREEKTKNGEMQLEHDPMNPEEKAQAGVHYDPRMWVEGQYKPDQLGAVLTSQGSEAVSPMTFAETGGDHNIDLSTDGKMMIYSTTRWSANPQICMQSITGKAVRRLTDDHMSDMMPKFHPFGSEIAWCSNRAGNWDIWIQRIDDAQNRALTQLTRDTDDEIHPCYSPDGKLIAFSRFNGMDGNWQIWVIDIENRVLSAVTEGLFPEFRPVVDKSGGRERYTIAYQRNRVRDVPFFSIWTVDVAMNKDGSVDAVTSPAEVVSSGDWAAITPAWSPDGNYLTFATVRKSMLAQFQARIYRADDIWVVKRDGTNLTQITSHSAPDWDPFWAKDPADSAGPGRIYFDSTRSGQPNIYSVRPVVADILVRARPESADKGAGGADKGEDK